MCIRGDVSRAPAELTTLPPQTTPDVPALAGLTLTSVEQRQLVLIGGFSPEYGFQEKTLAYGVDAMDWRVLNTTGTVPVGEHCPGGCGSFP